MRLNSVDSRSLRVVVAAICVAACASLAGCASGSQTADAPWRAAGNNGGKVDRYAVARAASVDASVQVATAPATASRAQ